MKNSEYIDKVLDFINNNDITRIDKNPTERYVEEINKATNDSPNLLSTSARKYLKPICAKALIFTGLLKIHKIDVPIRPVINYSTSPCYKLSKFLERLIRNNIVFDKKSALKIATNS